MLGLILIPAICILLLIEHLLLVHVLRRLLLLLRQSQILLLERVRFRSPMLLMIVPSLIVLVHLSEAIRVHKLIGALIDLLVVITRILRAHVFLELSVVWILVLLLRSNGMPSAGASHAPILLGWHGSLRTNDGRVTQDRH